MGGGHYYIIASADYTEGAEGLLHYAKSALTHYRYKCNLVEFIIFKQGSVNRTSDPLTFCGNCAIL